jgi:hypothetical protein
VSDFADRPITDGKLVVPLDATPTDGSISPETSQVQACLVLVPIVAAAGSIDPPPQVDCSKHIDLKYAAKPSAQLQADLGPLLADLPAATGLVLLPDATKAGPTDNWRVVFSAHDRTDAAKTPPAQMTLTLGEPPAVPPPAVAAAAAPPISNTGLPAITPPANTSLAAPPAVASAPQPATAPQVAAPAAPAVAAPQLVRVGYAYPIVWLLPLAFLILVPVATSALTKDLTPRRPEETGAASSY